MQPWIKAPDLLERVGVPGHSTMMQYHRFRGQVWRVQSRVLTLGATDEQISQCKAAGDNSYCSSEVKVLAKLAADP
jgi:hypothetical protein